jgi:hypothetical protein
VLLPPLAKSLLPLIHLILVVWGKRGYDLGCYLFTKLALSPFLPLPTLMLSCALQMIRASKQVDIMDIL